LLTSAGAGRAFEEIWRRAVTDFATNPTGEPQPPRHRTPAQAGTFSFTIQVQDAQDNTASGTVTVTIQP